MGVEQEIGENNEMPPEKSKTHGANPCGG